MPNKQEIQSKVKNPCTGAGTFGLGGAAVTALGAYILGSEVQKEALVVLVGGVITGAMAGTIGCCLPQSTENTGLHIKCTLGLLETGLAVGALLTAPIMGETIMQLGTEWKQTVIDELVGSATVAGGACGLVAVGAIAVGACYGFGSLWNRSAANNTPAANLPFIDIEDIEAGIPTAVAVPAAPLKM